MHAPTVDAVGVRGVDPSKLTRQKSPVSAVYREGKLTQGPLRDLALFDLGIDSKLRACDLAA